MLIHSLMFYFFSCIVSHYVLVVYCLFYLSLSFQPALEFQYRLRVLILLCTLWPKNFFDKDPKFNFTVNIL